MAQIKFSHHYVKQGTVIHNETTVKLLEVLIVNLEDLSVPFKEFDTKYYARKPNELNSTIDLKYYELPKKGKFLLLLMLLNDRLIPTLRRWTPEKEKYYKGLVGTELEMVIGK